MSDKNKPKGKTGDALESLKTTAADSGLRILGTVAGLSGANFLGKKMKISTITGAGMITLAGAVLACAGRPAMEAAGLIDTKPNPWVDGLVTSIGVATATYGLIKTANILSQDAPVDTGVKGLGTVNVPAGLKSFLKDWVPSLNGPELALRGFSNGQIVEMKPNADGSYSMHGLGSAMPPMDLPNLAVSGLGGFGNTDVPRFAMS